MRGTSDTELSSAQHDYDKHLKRQNELLGRVDVASMVQQLQQRVPELDKGEEEREVIEAGGNGTELTHQHVRQLMRSFKDKRAAYHAADIQASAAERLLR